MIQFFFLQRVPEERITVCVLSCVQMMLRAANLQTWWTINKHTAGHSINLTACVSGAEGENVLLDRDLDIKLPYYMSNYFSYPQHTNFTRANVDL